MDGLTLDGFLLRGPEGRIRLLALGATLDIDADDLLALEELAPEPGIDPTAAVRARLTLRRGFRVHDLGDGRALADRLRATLPFAFAARAGDPPHAPPPAFVARERAYVAALEAFERGGR